METAKSEPRTMITHHPAKTVITHYPETIRCFKCNGRMTKGDTYIGESSSMWPIGQMYHCYFCHESVGIAQDGRVTYWTGKVIGRFSAEEGLIWAERVQTKLIWELTETEMDGLLADPPERTPETERLLVDLGTYLFIEEERSKETAEKWRKWQGQLYGAG